MVGWIVRKESKEADRHMTMGISQRYFPTNHRPRWQRRIQMLIYSEKIPLLSVCFRATRSEKTLEEEQKILEEKQKKLKTEHEINVK